MNLQQVIRAIERIAAEQPNIGSVVRNDVFRLNAAPSVRYGAFAWLQGEHTTDTASSLVSYAFTFFYVDRLTENAGNEVEIQSVGIETLENILRRLEAAGFYSRQHAFRVFNQRFADDCAGVYCTVQLETGKDTLCPVEYEYLVNDGDYNLDYNEDYCVFVWHTGKRDIFLIK